MTIIGKAMGIAYAAHEGQVDKSGVPYIEHPKAVADLLPFSDTEGRVVAILHDVLEDTFVTAQDLLDTGIPEALVRSVEAITRYDESNGTFRDVEPVESYYRRVANDDIAYRVKLADIEHNTMPERMARLDDKTRARLERKYAKARKLLHTYRLEHLAE